MGNKIFMKLGNDLIYGWKSIQIRRSRVELCGSFQVSVSPGTFQQLKSTMVRGARVTFLLQEEGAPLSALVPLMTNAILETIRRSRTRNGLEVVISGRDQTCLLLDSDADIPGGSLTNMTIKGMADTFCGDFNIFVDDYTDSTTVFRDFRITPGERCFAVLERACRTECILLNTNRFGDLTLNYEQDSTITPAAGTLEYGKDILSIEHTETEAGVASEYVGKAQYNESYSAWVDRTRRILVRAENLNITDHKKRMMTPEQKSTETQFQKRVNWQCQVEAGEMVSVKIVTTSFTSRNLTISSENKPWNPNTMVNVKDEELDLNGKMLIDVVTFTSDKEDKEKTELELAPPNKFNPNPSNRIKMYG